MPGVLGMEDLAQTSGPNASLDYGEAKKMQDLQRQTSGLGAAQQPTPSPSGGPGPPSPAPSPGGPSQPAPPASAQKAAPLPPTQPQEANPMPWRKGLRIWAEHPQAGPYLKAMAALSRLDQATPEQLKKVDHSLGG